MKTNKIQIQKLFHTHLQITNQTVRKNKDRRLKKKQKRFKADKKTREYFHTTNYP